MNLTDRQDLTHPDMANPREMNEIIWFSVRGDMTMPVAMHMPAFELMTAGVNPNVEENETNADED